MSRAKTYDSLRRLDVFIAIVTDDTDRSDITRELLNSDREFYSSI